MSIARSVVYHIVTYTNNYFLFYAQISVAHFAIYGNYTLKKKENAFFYNNLHMGASP